MMNKIAYKAREPHKTAQILPYIAHQKIHMYQQINKSMNFKQNRIMNETMIYELRNLMKNAKAALEIAHYMGELPTFVEELNIQADAPDMTI